MYKFVEENFFIIYFNLYNMIKYVKKIDNN